MNEITDSAGNVLDKYNTGEVMKRKYDAGDYTPVYDGNVVQWSDEEFENFLSTKKWREEVKDNHRKMFNGRICFNHDGSISY